MEMCPDFLGGVLDAIFLTAYNLSEYLDSTLTNDFLKLFYSEICPAQALAFTVGYLFFVSYVVSRVYLPSVLGQIFIKTYGKRLWISITTLLPSVWRSPE